MKYFLLFSLLIAPFSIEGARHKRRCIEIPAANEETNSLEQEVLAVRRIYRLWKDNDYPLVRTQIYEFFDRFPASEHRDDFQVMLGNIALCEKEYRAALSAFESVRDPQKREKARVKRWQALYQMQNFTALYQELSPVLPYLNREEVDESRFLFAESAFREAMTLSRYAEGEGESKRLAHEALPYYEALREHKRFGRYAKLAIAEIHRLLGHHEDAAALYLEIAKKEKENEELLFHAAVMLSKFDEVRATAAFRDVAYLGGVRSSEAAYQWMQLLAKRGTWNPLFTERALFLAKLPSHRLPLLHFYCGMVHYNESKWKEAVTPLKKSLDLGLIYPHDKNALYALAVCGYELSNVELVEKVFAPIEERYLEELGEVALLRALTYKKVAMNAEALKFLDEVIAAKHSPSVMRRALRERAFLLVDAKRWGEAYETAQNYLELFLDKEMLKLVVDLSLRRLDSETGYQELTANIERGRKEQIFSRDEEAYYLTLLAKGWIKQERYKDALNLLEQLERSGERESLLALCYLKEGCRPEFIIAHGERALSLDPNLPEKERLHLYLFNAYLDAAKESNDSSMNLQAEEHLYCIVHTFPVSLENRLWLAHRFAKNQEKKERAIEIFEALLHAPTQVLRFPREAFVLANLYTEKGELNRAGILLENLLAIQEESPFAEEVRLSLAHHYNAKGELQRAFTLYEELESSPEASVALSAKLQKARLHFALFPEEIDLILPDLKDLWTKKRIAHEPIHLEAAFDFLDFQQIDSSESLQLLRQLKDHFSLEDDIWSKDYHASRCQMPEKDLIYQAYMRYLDARIYQIEAALALAQGRLEESENRRKTARALLSTLSHGKFAVSKYLVEKVQKEMYDRP
ncbi:MAG: hypothetical protein H7A36_03945 [Chlamydiales bacterium]|nr:hypothetical protein [Chlamydiales bacterium]